MIILGVDPGSNVTGYGLIDGDTLIDYGCIRPKSKLPPELKRKHIYEGILYLIEKHKPEALAVETQYVRHNPRSALMLGMVRGVIILAATVRNIPIFEYAPSQAKLAVSGSGRASKEQVQGMIQRLFNLDTLPTPEDAADALAIAICHKHRS